jgi:GNAT superfamily N-acetyltransferase
MLWRRDGYHISTDPDRLDREAIWSFLRTSYWSPGIEREVVERGIDNSLVFGLYAQADEQAGFARVVTDRARFGWLADVFVLDAHRGRGLGVWLVQTIVGHPELASCASCWPPKTPTRCTGASASGRSTPRGSWNAGGSQFLALGLHPQEP